MHLCNGNDEVKDEDEDDDDDDDGDHIVENKFNNSQCEYQELKDIKTYLRPQIIIFHLVERQKRNKNIGFFFITIMT